MDTVNNLKKLNRSKQFREYIADFAGYLGRKRVMAIIEDNSLTDNEKNEAFCEYVLAYYNIRIQMVRHGQKEWGFPENAFSDQFLDWYMEAPGSPMEKYIRLIIAGVVGEPILEAVMKDKIRMPNILGDLGEFGIANSPKLREAMRDFVENCDPTTEIPTFSEDDAIERIADALAKPLVSNINRIINDGESRWNDALEGIWRGSKGLLKRSALENFRKAFAGNEVQNYLRKAIQNQLLQELRKVQRDKAKKEANWYTEIIESDLPLIQDDEGNWIPPLELEPDIPAEDTELAEMQYPEALEFSEIELTIWKMKSEGETKKQIAKRLGISRPTLDKHLKRMRKKIRDLQSNELGISPSDLYRPGSIKRHGKWQRAPDPTPYKAMINMIREEFNKLTK